MPDEEVKKWYEEQRNGILSQFKQDYTGSTTRLNILMFDMELLLCSSPSIRRTLIFTWGYP